MPLVAKKICVDRLGGEQEEKEDEKGVDFMFKHKCKNLHTDGWGKETKRIDPKGQ